MVNGNSIIGLVKEFNQQRKRFIREEIQLAKKEFSEKLSKLGKNSVSIAIGGCVAYAGLIVFLGALGALLAYFLQGLGLDRLLAVCCGLGIVGLAVIATGAIVLLNGMHAVKKGSLAPERTIQALQHLRGTEEIQKGPAPAESAPERSSAQIHASVLATESEMAETLEELGDRVTLKNLRRQAGAQVRRHPYRWGFVAMGTGAAATYVVKRRLFG